jgi:hypothetical protein
MSLSPPPSDDETIHPSPVKDKKNSCNNKQASSTILSSANHKTSLGPISPKPNNYSCIDLSSDEEYEDEHEHDSKADEHKKAQHHNKPKRLLEPAPCSSSLAERPLAVATPKPQKIVVNGTPDNDVPVVALQDKQTSSNLKSSKLQDYFHSSKNRNLGDQSTAQATSSSSMSSSSKKKRRVRPRPHEVSATKSESQVVDLCNSSEEEEEDDNTAITTAVTSSVPQITKRNPPAAAVSREEDTSFFKTEQKSLSLTKERTARRLSPDSQSENDQQQQLVPTTTATFEELQSKCWKCLVTLKLDNTDGEFCCYAMHTHPLFNVPTCCVCSQEVAAVEVDSHEDAEWCSGCGLHETDLDDSLLFLCDGTDCYRAFCGTCVAQANGGGHVGAKEANRLIASDDDSPWQCPLCTTPTALQNLQAHMDRLSSADNGDKERTVDDVLRELDIVESKKEECENFEQPECVQDMRNQIREELIAENCQPDELEDEVQAEIDQWLEETQKHEQRLSDLASNLQDELETIHDVDLAKYYKGSSYGHDEQETAETNDEPDWKKEADAEIEQLHRQNLRSTSERGK